MFAAVRMAVAERRSENAVLTHRPSVQELFEWARHKFDMQVLRHVLAVIRGSYRQYDSDTTPYKNGPCMLHYRLERHHDSVAYAALQIARSLGLSDEWCFVAHLAGFTHDLGKTHTLRFGRMFMKNGAFDAEERKLKDEHPMYSVLLLLSKCTFVTAENTPIWELLLKTCPVIGNHHGEGIAQSWGDYEGDAARHWSSYERYPWKTETQLRSIRRILSRVDFYIALRERRDLVKPVLGHEEAVRKLMRETAIHPVEMPYSPIDFPILGEFGDMEIISCIDRCFGDDLSLERQLIR